MNILVVVGTRPEAVKMAPVIHALCRHQARPAVKLCLTAQHRELLDRALAAFDLHADFDLDVMRPDQSLSAITCAVLRGMEPVLEAARADVVLVHGDTTTSFAAALAAHYQNIPVGHVEAGLRTHDRLQPFPEELNRRMTDDLCMHHFAPTERARENLLREGVDPTGILVTGNTAVDALRYATGKSAAPTVFPWDARSPDRKIVLATAHRRESFGAPFDEICQALRSIVDRDADVEIVFPVHPNPNVLQVAHARLGGRERIHLVPPLDYVPFVHLMRSASLIITDSGGIQEEAPSLGVPVLVLRRATERPEAIDAGVAELVGTNHDTIVEAALRALRMGVSRAGEPLLPNPFGDGHASERIADYLLNSEGANA